MFATTAAHYRTTGPEIWEQTGGRVTAFVASIGSGGTIAGVSQFLKERDPAIRTILADPYGAAMWFWFRKTAHRLDDCDLTADYRGASREMSRPRSPGRRFSGIPDTAPSVLVYHLLRLRVFISALRD